MADICSDQSYFEHSVMKINKVYFTKPQIKQGTEEGTKDVFGDQQPPQPLSRLLLVGQIPALVM